MAARNRPGIGKTGIHIGNAVRIIRKIVILPLVISSNPFCGRFRQSQAVIVIDAVKRFVASVHSPYETHGHLPSVSTHRPDRRLRLRFFLRPAHQFRWQSESGYSHFFVIHNIIKQNPFLVQAGYTFICTSIPRSSNVCIPPLTEIATFFLPPAPPCFCTTVSYP